MNTKNIEPHNQERLQYVSAFLKEYRVISGLEQQELSEWSDTHRNTIIRYESNMANNLTLLTVFRVADALELDIHQIFLDI